jgi:hypothetical protein
MALTDPDFGEQTAQSGENACSQQLRTHRSFPDFFLTHTGYERTISITLSARGNFPTVTSSSSKHSQQVSFSRQFQVRVERTQSVSRFAIN